MQALRLIASVSILALAGASALVACGGGGSGKKAPQRTVLTTEYDDARVGRESSQAVAAQMGLLNDPALDTYIDSIGHKLLRGVPRRGFDYQFHVVDQMEPNAFALPGGYIFVSRGLLALANNEDELACVLGHEITHAAARHAAAQQALAARQSPLAMGWMRAATLASYGRDMERDADRGGQILCAAAGYDPMGMSTFLAHMGQAERMTRGFSRRPTFFDTHPGATERAAVNAARTSELRWRPDPSLGDTRASFLRRVDGMPVGQRPESGIFEGDLFLHPEMNFHLRVPHDWTTANTTTAVGAIAPRGDAIIVLEADQPEGPAREMAEAHLAKMQEEGKAELQETASLQVGDIDAWRLRVRARAGGGSVSMVMVFIPYNGVTFRITGMTRGVSESRYTGRFASTARSFGPLTERERRSIQSMRLRVVRAQPGESFPALGQRTGNAWEPGHTAVYNGLFANHRFEGGELVKISLAEPYVAPGR